MITGYAAITSLLALLIAVSGAYLTLIGIQKSFFAPRLQAVCWRVFAGVIIAIGGWTTHYVALLPFHGATVQYRIDRMLLTLVLTALCSVPSALLYRHQQAVRVYGAAVLMGAALAVVHFTGMTALHTHQHTFSKPMLAASIALALLLSVLHFSWVRREHFSENLSHPQTLQRAVLIGLSIVSFHIFALFTDTGISWHYFLHRTAAPPLQITGFFLYLVAATGLLFLGSFVYIVFENQRAKELALLSGLQYHSLFSENVEGVLLLAADGRIRESNAAAAGLLGYQEDELKGMPVSCLLAKGHPEGSIDETSLRRKDGSACPVLLKQVRVHSEAQAHGIFWLFMDLTQQKEMERQLKESERLHRIIAEHMSDYIKVLSADRKLQYVSPSYHSMFGMDAEYDVLQDVSSCVHPDDRAVVLGHLNSTYTYKRGGSLEYRRRHADGSWVWVETFSTPMLVDGRIDYIVLATKDIRARKQYEEQLERMAYYDPLTGAGNRRFFEKYIQRILQAPQPFALLYMDFDGFKQINDLYSHEAGDAFLQEVAVRISAVLRQEDCLARLGGDEFVVVLPSAAAAEAASVAKRILHTFQQPFCYQEHIIRTTVSIGIACFPLDGQTSAELLRKADEVLYQVKENGRNGYALSS
ncbi:diguanylate cyclase domain-containing protein [Ectobacillus ponti]|uniref:Diguanylate cyclase n=1 Tax=Ectobacillus ponti TaxID=2961894 RepID=A0AA42BRE3_9BACI|nr:diguanylate cyclase [Ectobacillus ponti]MCP8970842.1 diguanylate cyclase [Ectobacillus ponti]